MFHCCLSLDGRRPLWCLTLNGMFSPVFQAKDTLCLLVGIAWSFFNDSANKMNLCHQNLIWRVCRLVQHRLIASQHELPICKLWPWGPCACQRSMKRQQCHASSPWTDAGLAALTAVVFKDPVDLVFSNTLNLILPRCVKISQFELVSA